MKEFGKLRQSDMNYKFLEFLFEFESKSVLRFLDENSKALFLIKPSYVNHCISTEKYFYVLR